MVGWTRAVTHPLGLVAFALFLLFSILSFLKRRNERRVAFRLFLIAACISLAGGLGVAYMQARKSLSPTNSKPLQTPSQQQTNQVRQTTTGAGSPAVQGIQGDVTITVDQRSDGKTVKKSPPPPKDP